MTIDPAGAQRDQASGAPHDKSFQEQSEPVRHIDPRIVGFLAILLLALSTLACNISNLVQPVVPTVAPTRALAPTFTPTPDSVAPLVVVTPPRDGSPGIIIIQPTIDAGTI